MSIPKQMIRLTDFSGGQISASAKRATDKPLVRASARQMENYRILNTGLLEKRPGRRALFLSAGRTDEVRLGTEATFKLCFGAGKLEIRDGMDAIVATDNGRPWGVATVHQIVWTVFDTEIFITYPGMVPRVAMWSGSSWSFSNYAFRVGVGSSLRAPFYRFLPTRGITITPGSINPGASHTVTFSADVLTPQHVGTLFRYHGAQLRITAVANATTGSAQNIDYLPQSVRYEVDSSDGFIIGEIVEGATTGSRAEVRAVPDGTHIDVIVLNNRATGIVADEIVIGVNTRSKAGTGSALAALPTTVWDEQAISAARGWPQSCATDASRLIFCDLPSLPEGIIWSAISDSHDLLPTASATDAIFETIAGRPRVYHVVGGADEFVFTDRGVKYIPISESNPLRPGSVAFREITSEAASQVRPVSTAEGVIYTDQRRGRVCALVGTGQSARPYLSQDVSEFHADLFKMPKALAVTTGGGAFPERYIFALNADGTLAVGKFNPSKEWVGWVPWTSAGAVQWISALDANVLLTTKLLPNNVERQLVEMLESATYLDGQVEINNMPVQLAPAPGKGPLWWRASSEIALVNGLRFEGFRQVDPDGFIVPEEGEDLSDPGLVAGDIFTSSLVPFVPHAPEGQSHRQSQRRRKVGRITVAVQDSTGLMVDSTRIPPWRQGEDQAGQPPLREETYSVRKLGRDIDPTITIVKDDPGPVRIVEIGMEVTV